ncbi:MAG: DnaD domain protein [Chloroflexi bacterium]|nr:DnaD domain protein [Chloroflexota bacterium]
MKHFGGFPLRMQFTPLPNLFFSALLPQIDDMAELKTTLHIFEAVYRKRGYPRFVTYRELLGHASLVSGIGEAGQPVEPVLREALQKAAQRGTVLHLALNRDDAVEDVYFINTAANREVIARIRSGQLQVGGLRAEGQVQALPEAIPDIFTLYEENVGVITPLIADELRQAEKLYPETWIRDAIREAVSLNRRSWRYIARILERWSAEGRDDGTHRRHPSQRTDPDKYFKGKYGHIVQR